MSRTMKDSKIPFAPQIPETWKEIPNRFLFLEHSSKVGERWKEYQLLSLTTNGVKEKNINDTGGKVPDSYDNYQTVEKGDMVFCLFDLDCSAVFSGLSTYDGMITSAYDVFRTNEKYLDSTYARFWFDYVFSRRYYKMFSKNIRYTITTDVFKSIYTPCPPIAEQKRIGAFLDKKCSEIDEMISLQEKIVEELKAYKQSVITEAVCKGLNPDVPMKDSGYEWLGTVPETWRIEPLKYVLRRRNEKNSPVKSNERLSLSIGIGITRYEDKTTNLDRFKDDFTQYQLAYPNDIVLNSMNMIVGAVGMSKFFGCVSPVYYVMTTNPPFVPSYYAYLLNIPTIRWVYHSLGKGIYAIERGEGRVNTCRLKVPFEDFGRIEIPVPPIQEQQTIADYLDKKCSEIDALISLKQSKIEALREYKKSIIYEYITGKKELNG